MITFKHNLKRIRTGYNHTTKFERRKKVTESFRNNLYHETVKCDIFHIFLLLSESWPFAFI